MRYYYLALLLTLTACGDDAAITMTNDGGDGDAASGDAELVADADPAAPDARADAMPPADANPAAPDAGTDATQAVCNPDDGTSCASGGCYLRCTDVNCGAFEAFCAPAGVTAEHQACDSTVDCAPGLSCFTESASEPPTCYRNCRVGGAECTCAPFSSAIIVDGVEYGFCS